MRERALTVRDRIIVHLAPFLRYAEEFECPEDMSQAGISRAIGKSRAHTTLEINRMRDAGLLTERLAHVKGAKSKRKTYTLTQQALLEERRLMDHLDTLEVRLNGNGENHPIYGREALDLLVRDYGISRALAVEAILDSGGEINPERLIGPQRTVEQTISEHQPGQFSNLIEIVKARNPEIIVVMGMPGIGENGSLSETSWANGFGAIPAPGMAATPEAEILRANLLSKKGNHAEALAILNGTIEAGLADGGLSKAYYSRASVFRKLGDAESAGRDIEMAASAAECSGDGLMVARCIMEKAMIMSSSMKPGQTLAMLEKAMSVFSMENSQLDLLRCGINTGIVLRGAGQNGKAIAALEKALSNAEKSGLDRLRAYAMVNLTDLLNEAGDFKRSIELATGARDIFRVLDEPLMLAASMFNLGAAQAGLGKKDLAIRNLTGAMELLDKKKITRNSWLEKYAQLMDGMGEPERAASARKRAAQSSGPDTRR